MPKVNQEIPDGRFCTTIRVDVGIDNQGCIFLDRNSHSIFKRGLEGFTCRRHPNTLLGMELGEDGDKVVKCYTCHIECEAGDDREQNTGA